MLSRISRSALPCWLLALWLCATPASAQTLPPELRDQLAQTIGDRVEALSILGGHSGIAGGIYFFGTGKKEIDLTKVGGSGTFRRRHSLFGQRFEWAPILQANIGYISAKNQFEKSIYAGNINSYSTLGAQLGGGMRIYLNDWLSLAARVGAIYGRTTNEFTATNAAGAEVERLFGGEYVNWTLNTVTLEPKLGLRAAFGLRDLQVEIVSDYAFFRTWSFGESTSVIEIEGNSHAWSNMIDLHHPLGVDLFGYGLEAGGYYQRVQIYGDLANGLKTNATNTANARLVLNVLDRIPFLHWLGAGGSYFWGDNFSGWTVGVDIRTNF